MLSTVVLSNENQTHRGREAPASLGGEDVTLKEKLRKLTIAALSLGFAIVLTNTKPITAKASNDNLENTGITDDGFSYTIENGEATITSYSLNPHNDLSMNYVQIS